VRWLGFVGALAIGLGLMVFEHDRPVRRLAADAVELAKGKGERLPEERHGGRLGSVARSVNIHIDKLAREARAARRDLDQLLGPADGSFGSLDAIDVPAPPPRAAPPPAEFRFRRPASSRPSWRPGAPAPPPAARDAAPAPRRRGRKTRRRSPGADAPPPPAKNLDDDILASAGAVRLPPPEPDERRTCSVSTSSSRSRPSGEPTAGLLRQVRRRCANQDELMAKPGTVGVRFSVYVKDGKAALKATPVKDA
jgi:hypothetical protein